MKNILLLLLVVFAFVHRLSAQLLPEVPVWGNWEGRPDASVIRDSSSLAFHQRTSDQIGQQLQMQSALWIRQSAPGNYASVSYRGYSSVQTQLSWEGLPLNSPALAVSDLNALPSSASDQLAHITGGSMGTLAGNAAGGVLELKDNELDAQKPSISLGAAFGSFQTYSTQAEVLFKSSPHFFHQLRFSKSGSKNNFPYKDVFDQNHLRQGADYSQQALKYRALWKKGSSKWTYALWYQDQDLGIADNMLTAIPREQRQQDVFIRQFLQYKSNRHRLRAAWLYEEGSYHLELNNIYDFNAAHTAIVDWDYALWNSEKHAIDIGASALHQYVWGFEKEGSRDQLIAYANYRPSLWHQARLDLGMRLDVANDGRSLPSAHMTFLQNFSLAHQFRLSYSGLNRRPGLNDLYWFTGGNPSLNPESGQLLEAAWKSTFKLGKIRLSPAILSYYTQMNDMIVWLPGATFWSPENTENVQAHGLESALDIGGGEAKWTWNIGAAYQYTWSVWERKEVKTLAPGVPVHRIRAQAKIKRDRTYISLSHQQTNDWHQLRDSGSLSLLQGLDLYNLQLGTQFRWNSMNAHVSFTIQNLSDKAYMMQPFMPMPGRSYQVRIQLDYEFKKAQKN